MQFLDQQVIKHSWKSSPMKTLRKKKKTLDGWLIMSSGESALLYNLLRPHRVSYQMTFVKVTIMSVFYFYLIPPCPSHLSACLEKRALWKTEQDAQPLWHAGCESRSGLRNRRWGFLLSDRQTEKNMWAVRPQPPHLPITTPTPPPNNGKKKGFVSIAATSDCRK